MVVAHKITQFQGDWFMAHSPSTFSRWIVVEFFDSGTIRSIAPVACELPLTDTMLVIAVALKCWVTTQKWVTTREGLGHRAIALQVGLGKITCTLVTAT